MDKTTDCFQVFRKSSWSPTNSDNSRKVTTNEFHGQVTPAVAVESAVSVTL